MTKILLVEDNINQCLLYKQELEHEGYKVITANNEKDAFKKMQNQTPDLIITEICMSEMDRIEALGWFFNKHKYIPILLNTAYSNYKDHYMARIADALVFKSSDLTVLKNKIKELLSKGLKMPTWKY
ncbi:cheY-like receiver protein [Candidatus Scalindua japonica]|uniref:CheY-like receiver protein n=1 Tax=Candidatus Scalindua japonica TaxID=1284222 RepID=A0A286TW50_9BACT|nr:response regulator [Candidatus Scalindua japonica]GAX60095.1 cheY-like receiver protein [Candidatus Scalindua japonica]